MKKICGKIAVMAGLIMLVTAIFTPMATADGWHPSEEYLHLYEPSQKAVIYWNGVTETLILSSAAKSDNLTNIAWVVPILSTTMPNVTAGNMSVFQDLVDYFKKYEYPHYMEWYNRVLDGNVSGVIVLESKEVDIYDVIIIKATNASDLIDWLTENNFKVPKEAQDVLEKYVRMDSCYFVVNKIDLKNKYQDVIELIDEGIITIDLTGYVGAFHSLEYFERCKKVQAFQILCNKMFFSNYGWNYQYSEEFLVELGVTEEEYLELVEKFSTDDQKFTEGITANNLSYKDVNELIADSDIREKYDAIYEALSEKLDPIYDYYQIKQDLKQGMATPLKFEFTPLKPYYPLTISSLNAGYGVIEVYVIGENPAIDVNEVLTVEECKEVNEELREKLSQHFSVEKADYVTRLSFHGRLEDLSDDAVFTFYPLSKPKHPIFTHVTSDLENLTEETLITGIAWDPDGEVLEVQFKIDDKGLWQVADGNTHWSLKVNTTIHADGNHTLQIRELRRIGMSTEYSETNIWEFSTQKTDDLAIVQQQNVELNAIILAGLVILSIVAVAFISKKTMPHH